MRIKTAALLLMFSSAPVWATGLGAPVKLGEATLRVLGQNIYSATLHTEGAARFSWRQPLSLRLDYAYGFAAKDLLAASAREMKRINGAQADDAVVLQKLSGCFRDVRPGDVYLAVSNTPDRVVLRLNGEQTCDLRHANIRERFLGIWLSPQSRSARLSRQLRGD